MRRAIALQALSRAGRIAKPTTAPPIGADEISAGGDSTLGSAKQTPLPGEWLNTGDAYAIASPNGYESTQTTFRRDLRQWRETGKPPARLTAMGMRADLAVRAAANDKENSVKWLGFEDFN